MMVGRDGGEREVDWRLEKMAEGECRVRRMGWRVGERVRRWAREALCSSSVGVFAQVEVRVMSNGQGDIG